METQKTFKRELSDWIKTKLPYWKQYLAASILLEKKLTDIALENTYQFFLQGHSLSPEESIIDNIDIDKLLTEAIADVDGKSDELFLSKISDFKNISAIKDGQVIDLNPQLTIIFGENGAGKSSYVRLFNNCFQSRGEKELIPNIYQNGELYRPSCSFEFNKGDKNISYLFPEDIKNIEFQLFTVFDSKSFKIHIENKNELLFLPKDFEFFNLMIEGLRKIELKHEEVINSRKKENLFIPLFSSGAERNSEIKEYVLNLNSTSSIYFLKEKAVFSAEEEKKITELEKARATLISQEVERRLKEENGLLTNMLSLRDNILQIFELLSLNEIDNLNALISEQATKKALIDKSGLEQFKDINLAGLGSDEWRAFIESAFNLSAKHLQDYPENNDEHCILCNQLLSNESKQLILNLWKYINSVVEDEYRKVTAVIQNRIKVLKSLSFNQLDETSYLYQKINLDVEGEKILIAWKDCLSTLHTFRDNVVLSLENYIGIEYIPIENSFSNIDGIIDVIKIEIQKLQNENPNDKIQKYSDEIELLTHRRILKGISDEVENFILNLKWISQAITKTSDFNSSSITRKQTELFDIFVSGNYLNRFKEECRILNAELNVEITQQGKKGNTLRELKIRGFALKQILSEGEQRAISIADFLTEINLSIETKGIILDDPVNSLDHKRKRIIAERFIEESRKRQVIIFTHDLMFVSYLKIASEQQNVDFSCHWIQKNSDGAGQVYLNNSPSNEADYKNANIAKDYHQRAVKSGPQEQEHLLKQGFGALRTNYEAFVIFELFSDVIQRFNERISIGRLKDVVIDDGIVNQIIEKTEYLSRFIEGHLHSDEFVFNKPTPELLLSEIQAFENLKGQQKALKKAKAAL